MRCSRSSAEARRIRGEDRARGGRDDLWDLSGRVWMGSWLQHRRGHCGSGPCYRDYLIARFPHDECVATGAPRARDAFVSKLSPNGASLVYSTYLGGSRIDGRRHPAWPLPWISRGPRTSPEDAIRRFPHGECAATGDRRSVCAGGSDAFVVKITEDSLASPPAGDSLAGPPTNESISTSSERGGGGAMDALFLVLLAQLAFAGALRRRSGPGQ